MEFNINNMAQQKHNQVVDFSNPNADKIKSASTTNNMAQQNNKYAPYILSTIGYIIAVMFVLGDEETTVADRFLIIYIWIIWMGFTALISNIKNL